MKITAVYTDQALKERGVDPQTLQYSINKHRDLEIPVIQGLNQQLIVGKVLSMIYDKEAKHFIIDMEIDFDIGFVGKAVSIGASDMTGKQTLDKFELHDISLIAVPKPEEKENVE